MTEGRWPMTDAYELSAGLFVRGLTNLKSQSRKAEDHAAATGSGEAALLGAQLAAAGRVRGIANDAPTDLHLYTFADQVHWAAEGARLAIARLLRRRSRRRTVQRVLRISISASMRRS